jgi:hypothetical protein
MKRNVKKCDSCDRLVSLSNYKKHARSHTESKSYNYRPYFCDCGCMEICSQGNRFIRGHISRILNPSKDPEVAKRRGEKLKGRKNPAHSERMKGENNPTKRKEVKERIGKSNKGKLSGENNPSKRLVVRKRIKEAAIRNSEMTRQRMLNGEAAIANAGIKNPSKLQMETYDLVKELYSNAILNYSCLNYSIDVAIPDLKVAIEVDGSYWHQDKERDLKRQNKIEEQGWRVLRYKDKVPSIQRLLDDIKSVSKEKGERHV